MKGFDSNYLNTGDEYVVVEADEYDRSFLNLNPDYSVITSIEEDHLDVYHDLKEIYSSFNVFSDNTNKSVVAEKDLNIRKDVSFSIKDDADYSAKIIKNEQNCIMLVTSCSLMPMDWEHFWRKGTKKRLINPYRGL